MSQALALLLLGTAAGLFNGMLGMGGGVLKVAGMLLLLKLDIFFARAVALTTMFFAASSAVWPYAKRGFPVWESIRPMLPPAMAGLVGGVLLGNHLRSSTLACLFGFFVLFLGFYTLAMMFDDPGQHCLKKGALAGRFQRYREYLSGGIGVLHGFVCGLLGVSGGVISVPMQELLLNMPARNAIANSLVVSALCSGLGSAIVITIGVKQGAFSLEHLLFTVACVGSGAVLGAQIGVRMGDKTSTAVLKLLFVIMSFGAGLSLLI
ncbi:sulfite exporter TauE/SafE family protein [Planctomycetota bacterium]